MGLAAYFWEKLGPLEDKIHNTVEGVLINMYLGVEEQNPDSFGKSTTHREEFGKAAQCSGECYLNF